MTTLNKLLDKAMDTRSVASDNALAGLLGVTRQRVSNWRLGKNHPDAVACARIAEITGEPLARVLGVVGEARAITQDEKKVWRRLATAAAVLLTVGMIIPAESTAYNASSDPVSRTTYVLCALRKQVARMMQRLTAPFQGWNLEKSALLA